MEAEVGRHALDAFLNPTSVAVIGASTALDKTGGRRWRSLVEGGFAGPVYPIHPSAREVLGHPAYRSIRDVPGPVDLAVIILRPDLVPGAVEDCAELGVPGVVIVSGGFAEIGPEGARVEREIVARLRAGGGRLVGPNCAGLFSASARVNLTGWAVPAGPIALISQSGNVALSFAQRANEAGLGFSAFITLGNAADLRLPEYVEYFFDDASTRVVLAYIEGFGPLEGRALHDLVRTHPHGKPLVILKPGSTEGGRRAALSHTGALAGEDRIVTAAFRQCGVLRVTDSDEAWNAAVALALAPPLRRNAIVVVSDGGGLATVVCEAADRAGLALPPISDDTRSQLGSVLPPRSPTMNPVDFAGVAEEMPELIPRVLDICLGDPEIGGAIFAGHFGGYVRIATEELGRREVAAARELAAVVHRHGKSFVLHSIYAGERLPALEALRAAGVPIYRSLEASARAMAALRHAAAPRAGAPSGERRSRPDARRVAAVLGRATSGMLLEPDARDLLALYGVPVPPFTLSATPADTAQAARSFGVPVALKLVHPAVLHKTEIGGVLLDVDGPAAAAAGHEQLLERASAAGAPDARILTTPMIREGIELVVGAVRDPQFGPAVMVGLGGIFVEALGDVVFGLAPLTEHDAEAMIGALRSRRLLGALRGRPARDLASLVDVLVRISELIDDCPDVRGLDLNPLFLLVEGAAVADARVILDAPGAAGHASER